MDILQIENTAIYKPFTFKIQHEYWHSFSITLKCRISVATGKVRSYRCQWCIRIYRRTRTLHKVPLPNRWESDFCTDRSCSGRAVPVDLTETVSGKSFNARQQHPFISIPALMCPAAPWSRHSL